MGDSENCNVHQFCKGCELSEYLNFYSSAASMNLPSRLCYDI